MAGTTISGVGSGIDIQAIVTSLVNAEKLPKQDQINTQSKNVAATLSSIGKVKAALDAFRGALTTMGSDNSFSGLTGASSDEKVATMTLGTGATNGKFSLIVSQLAQPSKLSTINFSGGETTVVNKTDKTTTLTISQSGKNFDLSIPPGATLQRVRDSINAQFSSVGLGANILTDSNGSRLVLTSINGGVGSDITMSGNSVISTGYKVINSPQNAKYTIDGFASESKSNNINDAISGVSIKLLTTSPLVSTGDASPNATRTPLTLSIDTNTSALKSGVKGFIDTYNALLKVIKAETAVTIDAAGRPVAATLTGDTTMRTLQSVIRKELNLLSSTGTLKSLAQFGVLTDKTTGSLSINDKSWNKAILTNAADVSSIFNGKSGLLARLSIATDIYAKPTTGILAGRSDALSYKLNDLTKQQSTLDKRIAGLQTSLTSKYAAMDSLVAQLRQQSINMLGTLNALNNKSSS
ncbi:flagellar filament capping protein FliD [Pseudomonas costantinii]|uniref:flagellar filament capping protein FliD n=1 Tax=Pseudomonas costantinii TaxID=168469 RepID=UPI0015A3948D|nr:flagellar filament capping protein FliD [Pseudomonas costantinii]NVZ69582.1 flagellar filament capping protein FliD [Pseudomonas costantinii]